MKALVLTTALALLPGLAAAQQIAGVTSDDQVIYLSLQNGYQLCEIGKEGEGFALTDCKTLKTPEPVGMAALNAALAGGASAPATSGGLPSVTTGSELVAVFESELGCSFDPEYAFELMERLGLSDEQISQFSDESMAAGEIAPVDGKIVIKTEGCQ